MAGKKEFEKAVEEAGYRGAHARKVAGKACMRPKVRDMMFFGDRVKVRGGGLMEADGLSGRKIQ